MRILGTICARGGSKGVKEKNIRDLHGHPLIAYTIDVMKHWSKAERIVDLEMKSINAFDRTPDVRTLKMALFLKTLELV